VVEDGSTDVNEAVIRSILPILCKRSMYVVNERQTAVIYRLLCAISAVTELKRFLF
jgi:hypothetical protein